MDPALKIARQRLSVLELAAALGNVSQACRQRGMTRTQFYEYKRRFQTHGIEGLKDLPPVHKTHPQSTPEATVQQIIQISLEHPSWGCHRISHHLKLTGNYVSGPTVQRILHKNGLSTMYDRLFRLEEQAASQPLKLSAEQMAMIEKANPCVRERHIESSRPGELLAQDTFYVGHLKGVGKVYMNVVVDTYGSYAFALLHTGKLPEFGVALLHNDVLPFYEERGLKVNAVLTDNGSEFCGKQDHLYELYLALNDIEHRRTKVRKPQTNGFVERFNRTALDEFFRVAFRQKFYENVESLQADLDAWLHNYNYMRPHRGYRNMGRRPHETIDLYLRTVTEEA